MLEMAEPKKKNNEKNAEPKGDRNKVVSPSISL